jgi:iron-sulfur cluster assembly accessory protein
MVTAHTSTRRNITLTEEAVQMLNKLAQGEQKVQWGLKFSDQVSACGEGYNYIIDLVASPDEQDEVFWSQGIPIFVPRESVARLEGSTIEWHAHDASAEQSKSAFKKCFHVKNPNAKGECPCSCGGGVGY